MTPHAFVQPAQILLAGAACLAAALALAPAARAGDVVLWACHGPAGQPLGLGPLVAASAGDGMTATYGSGCSSPIGAVGDGGVTATFARSDPTAGSRAGWRVAVPVGTTLTAAALDRFTSGFGGPPEPGDPLLYEASTSAGPLESANLADASNVALSGHASFPGARGTDAGFAVSCAAAAGGRCAAPAGGPIGASASAIALSVTDAAPPLGAVGGVESPVAGPLPLDIRATDSGLGLRSASASIDGQPAATVALGGPTCAPLSSSTGEIDLALGADCPASVTDVPLTVSTAALDDGPHQLTVTLADAAGNTTTLVNRSIDVLNHLVVPGPSALISIGSGGSRPTVSGPGVSAGLASGAARPACASPRLSALLASRPLRISGLNVAVLWSGTRYLFTGRLTCLRDRRRVGAPIGTVIAIFSLRRHRLARERTGATTYGRRGRFRVLLHPRSSRTIIFQYGGGNSARRVRIPVLVTPVRSGRR